MSDTRTDHKALRKIASNWPRYHNDQSVEPDTIILSLLDEIDELKERISNGIRACDQREDHDAIIRALWPWEEEDGEPISGPWKVEDEEEDDE